MNWDLAEVWARGIIQRHFVLEDEPSVTSMWLFSLSFLIKAKLRTLHGSHCSYSATMCPNEAICKLGILFPLPWTPGKFLEVWSALKFQIRELAIREKWQGQTENCHNDLHKCAGYTVFPHGLFPILGTEDKLVVWNVQQPYCTNLQYLGPEES